MPGEIDCFDDIALLGGELTDPLDELAQDLYHRLIETPGSNPDDPDAGLGIEDALSGVGGGTALGHRIEAELQKDSRVDACQAVVTSDGDGAFGISIAVQPNAEELGADAATLDLELSVDRDGVRRAA